jgi:elongation factor Ts
MSNITAALVKELRERTQLPMMLCKKALVENDGNIEQAIEHLRKSSALKAATKSANITAEGIVAIKVADDAKSAVLIEVNSQTDFVARDENFLNFVNTLVTTAIEKQITNVDQLISDEIEQQRNALVTKVGENINIRRLQSINAQEGQCIGQYVHTNNRVAALVSLSGGDTALANSIAMHIVASKPLVINPDDVDATTVAKEKEIYTQQAQESGKPAEIIEKMVVGRLNKFLSEVSLTQQNFVVEPDKKVGQLLKAADATALSFACFNVGEGIDKKEVDFAQEVQESLNS